MMWITAFGLAAIFGGGIAVGYLMNDIFDDEEKEETNSKEVYLVSVRGNIF